MIIIIFEDGTHDNFYPASSTRALWDLRSGLFTFKERIERLAARDYPGSSIGFAGRAALAALYRETVPGISYNGSPPAGEILFVNALCAPQSLVLEPDTALVSDGRVVLLRLSAEKSSSAPLCPGIDWVKKEALSVKYLSDKKELVDHLWRIPLENGSRIGKDLPLFGGGNLEVQPLGVTFLGEASQIYVGRNVSIDPCVVVDARKGPVVIDDDCEIHPFTRIEGPCAIGKGCVVLGAKLREGCSFGPSCRVGGEVEEAVFQSCSNKYHDGFIGHAYIGEWVNLGAMTANSDLKNDYSSVKVYRPGGIADTGETKIGTLIGDFVKTSIGTLINTGSVLGAGSMPVMSGRMTPPHLPPFCRFIKNEIRDPGDAEAVIATAKTACSRRKKTLPSAMEELLRTIYAEGTTLRKAESEEWNAALK
jgi:UDP-N-acetylglucosamine diphosphorylase/glucosamine-1-phosphate N-acetyltransferase